MDNKEGYNKGKDKEILDKHGEGKKERKDLKNKDD